MPASRRAHRRTITRSRVSLRGSQNHNGGAAQRAHALLEACVRNHFGLHATLERVIPETARRLGASSAVVVTKDSEGGQERFCWGKAAPPKPLSKSRSPSWKREGGSWWAHAPLIVDGAPLGWLAFCFSQRARPPQGVLLETARIAEEIDGVLWSVQTARFKQRLVERISKALGRRVFRQGLDQAMTALAEAIPIERLVLLYIDETNQQRRSLRYRIYRGKRCTYDYALRPSSVLDSAIAEDGIALLSPDRRRVPRILKLKNAIESFLILGVQQTEYLGLVFVETPKGLDGIGRDLLQVFVNTLSQRLSDYRKERRHLSQYFNSKTASRLLSLRDYQRKYLAPREQKIAILYADIAGFSKLCELGLKDPERIGKFIDQWSAGAVKIIWKRDGVFDKMIGDCVIAHFGPPFYRRPPASNAYNALKTAEEIRRFTNSLGNLPAYARLAKQAGIKSLSVSSGIHLCDVSVGLFGPNHDFTAFGQGMNAAARLQSVAKFGEILVHANIRDALRSRPGIKFQGPYSTKAKNLSRPIRYYRAKGAQK